MWGADYTPTSACSNYLTKPSKFAAVAELTLLWDGVLIGKEHNYKK